MKQDYLPGDECFVQGKLCKVKRIIGHYEYLVVRQEDRQELAVDWRQMTPKDQQPPNDKMRVK